jgi:GntR family transcriptional regulator
MLMDAAPLYRGLRATLMAEISGGKFPVGSGFPTDYELCARFRVSRHTVREALRSLQDQGMLVRQPGSGTTVTALPGTPHYVHTIESLEQLYSNARTARLAIRHIGWTRLGQRLAAELERPEGERWLQVSGLRTIAEATQPQSWVDVFVAERYGAIRDEIVPDQPIHQSLERRFDLQISAIDLRLSAFALPLAIADLLGSPPHSPGLLIHRRYIIDSGETVEMSLSLQRGDQYSPTMRFRRSKKTDDHGTAPEPHGLGRSAAHHGKRGHHRPQSSRR